jgi:hypothetical protein
LRTALKHQLLRRPKSLEDVEARPHLKGIVYVADGTVVRIRGIDPDGP